MEKEENENRKENSRTALDGKLRVFKARLQLSLARMYFVKTVKVWLFLNPVCHWLSEMLHVYKSEVRVAVFET